MKRQERHHLKENELIHSIEATRDFVDTRKREIGIGRHRGSRHRRCRCRGCLYRQSSQSRGSELLAEAMVALNARVVPAGAQPGGEDIPAAASLGATGSFATESAKLTAALPKLQAAADAFPDSSAGITARYHLAGALAALSRNDEAIKEFDDVVQAGRKRTASTAGWRGLERPTRRPARDKWMRRLRPGRKWPRRRQVSFLSMRS